MTYRPQTWWQRLLRLGPLLRGVAQLLERWPMILLIFVVLSPVSPHLRVVYEYRTLGGGEYRIYTRCQYLGNRGAVEYVHGGAFCPIVLMLNAEEIRNQ